MAIGARPFYLFLTLFLFTQIVSVLWPKQHLFASRGTTYPSSWLSKRSLESLEPDIQCEDVWSHADRCAFVEQYCADYPAGLINYLHFYFCDLGKLPALAVVVLTGVTFLAFGNGSPDVFSTFSAIGAGSGSLAIGELVGAASFITSVVVGSMAIIKPFKVSRAPFLRDVSFFAGCVLFTLYAVLDGKITFLESLLLVAYYVFYVSFVVVGNWWHQRVKLERELEERARNMYEDDEADEGLQEDEPGVPDEERALLSGRSRTGAKLPNIVTQLVPGPYDAYEDEEHDDGYISSERVSSSDLYDPNQTLVNSYGSSDVNIPRPNLSNDSGGAQDSISLRPPGTLSLKRRPSLISAMEFNDVVRSLTLSGSRGRIASYDPSYYGPKSPRSSRSSQHTSSRPRSFNTTMSHGYRPASPHSYASTPQNGYLSPRGADDRAALSPSPLSMDSDEGTFDAHFEQALLRQSLILPDHHSPANHHLGHIHNPGPLASPGGVSTPTDVATIAMPTTKTERFIDLLKALKPIYFPTLLDWDNKSAFVRFLAITSVPMVLLLTLTLPVVELRDDEDESADELNNTNPTTGPPKIIIGEIEDEDCQYEGWSRTATTTQMLIAPVFIAAVLT
ncbi:hypothetical protein BGZ54_008750, partial [Gamsiella multidivaricata]